MIFFRHWDPRPVLHHGGCHENTTGPFGGIETGMRRQGDGIVREVITHGTVLHKPTEYGVVYYLPDEGTCYLEDEIGDVAEWSKAEEVARWLAITKPADSRFPKSPTDRPFGLRTHPIVRELPPTAEPVLISESGRTWPRTYLLRWRRCSGSGRWARRRLAR